jgi:hypothetical protein
MHNDGAARRFLPILAAGLVLALSPVADATAGEWEKVSESYGSALKANEKRIGEITAKERSGSEQERADKITKDKIASVRTSLKTSGKAKSLADAAEKASAEGAAALTDLSREQDEYLAVIGGDWGAEGAERKKLREAMATAQKNLERANASLTKAARTGTETSRSPSEALEKATRIDATVTEAGDRLRARWQNEQAARERETKQREREAGERARNAR